MAENPDFPTAEITFRNRTMEVRIPRPEQLIVWRRTLTRLQSANPENWTGSEAMAVLERSRKIIDSLLVNPADVDWLDDEMLAGRLLLLDANQIVISAIQAFQEHQEENTPPVKKTPRKKVRQ